MKLSNSFKQKGLSLSVSLLKAYNACKKAKIITSFYSVPNYNDEPKLHIYSAKLRETYKISDSEENVGEFSGGASFDPTQAALKTLGEAIERYCLAIYHKHSLKKGRFTDFSNALNPQKVCSFSKSQKTKNNFKASRYDKNSVFHWVEGYSLSKMGKILIPAQLVYVPYHMSEPIIRFPITTGAASGNSLTSAILRGIYEIVERDAFMITYLNKLQVSRIELERSENFLLQILNIYKKYFLELHLFDITTDLGIPSILALILDKTGEGPAVSIGLKSHMDVKSALLGAIEEAQHVRPWIRDELSRAGFFKKTHIHSILDRGLLWSRTEMIPKLNFLLKTEKRINIKKYYQLYKKNDYRCLTKILEIFKLKNYSVNFVDVTLPTVKKLGFYVIKVIIPELQPLYLDEDFKYLGCNRLYKVPNLLGYKTRGYKNFNTVPHPFL